MTRRFWAPTLILIYLVFRLSLDPLWRQITPYASFGFELLFVILSGLVYKKRLQLFSLNLPVQSLGFLLALLSGGLIYWLALFSRIPIPFDLQGTETILLLLVLAPILEEFIFRMALWYPLKDIVKRDSSTVVISALLFAIGHFISIWFVPESLRVFVLYQTLYVILLGLACGWAKIKKGSLFSAILIHFGFNLGFFVASRIFLN